MEVLCILLRYFQDTVSNSIEPCTLCIVDIYFTVIVSDKYFFHRMQGSIPLLTLSVGSPITMHTFIGLQI